jgi:hypothetical protein
MSSNMPKNRKVLWRRIRGLSRHVDVKFVPFPTQHLLNNRGFSSTLLKEDPSMEDVQGGRSDRAQRNPVSLN